MFKIQAGEYEDVFAVDVPEFENRADAEMFVKIYNMNRPRSEQAFIEELD